MPASDLASVHLLSPLQEGLLFHGLYEPRAARYVEQTVLEVAGQVDAAALEAAFAYALSRHPGLRTGFHWQGMDRPLAAVHAAARTAVAVHDWRRAPAEEVEARLAAFLAADRSAGFDLAQPPLLRLAVLAHGATISAGLVWTVHHILLDGWSSSVVLGDLLLAYEAATTGRIPGAAGAAALRRLSGLVGRTRARRRRARPSGAVLSPGSSRRRSSPAPRRDRRRRRSTASAMRRCRLPPAGRSATSPPVTG